MIFKMHTQQHSNDKHNRWPPSVAQLEWSKRAKQNFRVKFTFQVSSLHRKRAHQIVITTLYVISMIQLAKKKYFIREF